MVRSEVRLAKVEIRDEARRAASSAIWIAAGVAARERVDLPAVDARLLLATRMSMWAATLASLL